MNSCSLSQHNALSQPSETGILHGIGNQIKDVSVDLNSGISYPLRTSPRKPDVAFQVPIFHMGQILL